MRLNIITFIHKLCIHKNDSLNSLQLYVSMWGMMDYSLQRIRVCVVQFTCLWSHQSLVRCAQTTANI